MSITKIFWNKSTKNLLRIILPLDLGLFSVFVSVGSVLTGMVSFLTVFFSLGLTATGAVAGLVSADFAAGLVSADFTIGLASAGLDAGCFFTGFSSSSSS